MVELWDRGGSGLWRRRVVRRLRHVEHGHGGVGGSGLEWNRVSVADDSSTADDSSSGTESSTGDDVPMPTDARVFYTITQGTEEQNGTWLVDVVAGALGEPTRVDEDVTYPVSASPSGRWMVDGGPGGLPGMPIHVVGQSRWPNGQASPASTKLVESGHICG